MRHLAIIPARSGSKGLKDKNIKEMNGVPLLAYSIKAALESKLFDTVYVSTDSEEYAEIAKKYDAEVPFLRSKHTASDTASSWDVVREALVQYEKVGKQFDIITLLQPTTPLRTAKDIVNAFSIYQQKNAKAVISVCETDHSPLWCNTLPSDMSMNKFLKEDVFNAPRQQLNTYYRINGAIYMIDAEYILKTNYIYGNQCFAVIMAKENSIDIDDEFDFSIAELMLKRLADQEINT